MKKFLVRLKINCGEYEYSSKCVMQAKTSEEADGMAEDRAAEFYGDPDSGHVEGESYYFGGGAIAVCVVSVVEITDAEYEVLNKYLP
jgi:hypothetical protein